MLLTTINQQSRIKLNQPTLCRHHRSVIDIKYKYLFIAISFIIILISSYHVDAIKNDSSNVPHIRTKRGVLGLAGMISCITGCEPLSYKSYGCYCGIGGTGVPIDGIDR